MTNELNEVRTRTRKTEQQEPTLKSANCVVAGKHAGSGTSDGQLSWSRCQPSWSCGCTGESSWPDGSLTVIKTQQCLFATLTMLTCMTPRYAALKNFASQRWKYFICSEITNQTVKKCQDYGDSDVQNTTRAPKNKQLKIKAKKIKKLKCLDKDKCFQLASESVKRINLTKWRRQIVPSMRRNHSEQTVTKWWRGMWHCDRARRGGSEAWW